MGLVLAFTAAVFVGFAGPTAEDLEWEELPEPDDVAETAAPIAQPPEPVDVGDPPSTTEDEAVAAESIVEPTVDSAPEPEDPPPLQPPAPRSGPGPNWRRGGDSYYGGTLVGPIVGGARRSVAVGVGVTHFVVPYVGLGADLINVVRWDGDGSGAYYEFQLTPTLTLLALPRRRFTPLVWGGFGLDVFSHKLGTYGRWVGGAGFAFTAGRLAIVTIGVQVDGREPLSRWNNQFTCGFTETNCSLGLSPVIGFSIPL